MRSSDGSSDVCSSDLLAAIMRWGFEYMQDDDGGSVYLRLSTRQVEQPQRELTDGQLKDLLAGAYWQVEPAPGAELALVYSGGVVPEVLEAHRQLAEDVPGIGILAVPSNDRLYHDWQRRLRARKGKGR